MAHPHRAEVKGLHNAKLRAMTRHYGAASGPANNIVTPGERLKNENVGQPEADVGFGADAAMAFPRSDRPARRSVAANPVPTYARGGKVKHRDDGGAVDAKPVGPTGRERISSDGKVSGFSEGGVIQRARGGRAKGATHVNVIVAPQGQGAGAIQTPPPALAALAAGASPPPMPAGPPPAPPMAPPGAGGPPPMPMRAKGGRIKGEIDTPTHDDLDEDKRDLISKTLEEEGLIRKARGGGIHMTAGAATGIGRLEKMGIKARHRGSMEPKEI